MGNLWSNRYFLPPPSIETFEMMRASHDSGPPWLPALRRFKENGPFFYHYTELGYVKSEAQEVANAWRALGFNVRITSTKERATRGVRHGSWLIGSTHYHIWVGRKDDYGL